MTKCTVDDEMDQPLPSKPNCTLGHTSSSTPYNAPKPSPHPPASCSAFDTSCVIHVYQTTHPPASGCGTEDGPNSKRKPIRRCSSKATWAPLNGTPTATPTRPPQPPTQAVDSEAALSRCEEESPELAPEAIFSLIAAPTLLPSPVALLPLTAPAAPAVGSATAVVVPACPGSRLDTDIEEVEGGIEGGPELLLVSLRMSLLRPEEFL